MGKLAKVQVGAHRALFKNTKMIEFFKSIPINNPFLESKFIQYS
jgi:hypothetical protein